MILVVDNTIDGGELAGEIARVLPDTEIYDYPDEDGDPSLDGVDGVVLGGSEAGVYEEDDRPWITEQKEFVEDVVDAGIPLLGVCFGHQIVNEALGGTVVDSGTTRSHLVEAEFEDSDLFDGVGSAVPVLHSDVVTEPGDGLEVVGRTDYNDHFATRHTELPVWTVQYHPEFTTTIRPEYRDTWEENHLSLETSTAVRTLHNFGRFCEGGADDTDGVDAETRGDDRVEPAE